FELDGEITETENDQFAALLNAAIANYGTISILLVLHEDADWGAKAGLKDLKWAMIHFRKLDKVAVVSSSKVWKWLVKADSFLARTVGIKEKHFEAGQMIAAWRWLKA